MKIDVILTLLSNILCGPHALPAVRGGDDKWARGKGNAEQACGVMGK
jgi:hypothetical protein